MVQKYLPLINFGLSSAALTFQMFVLNPWTKEFDKRINDKLEKLAQNRRLVYRQKRSTVADGNSHPDKSDNNGILKDTTCK